MVQHVLTKNEKISLALKEHFAQHGNPGKGQPGWSQSNEQKLNLSAKQKAYWDKRGRRTEAQKKAANKANVYAYRARLYNAVPLDADLKLIKKIYEACPDGHQVDHIVALAAGGLHHQDNLQYLPRSENCKKGKNRDYDRSLIIRWQDIMQQG